MPSPVPQPDADPQHVGPPDRAVPSEPSGSPDAAGSPADHGVLLWLVAATFVVILNETITTTAIPRLMADFAVSAATAQWLSTAFMLTMAVVIPTTGWLLQRFTTRQAFAAAMTTFCAGTLLAGVAPWFWVLLLARVVQAGGTAIMMPLLMTTLMQVVHESDRGRVMGNVTLAISVAPALGPAVSGLILQALPWRFIFLLVLPVAAGISLAGLRRLRNVGEPTAEHLDGLSIPLAVAGFGGLVYGLSEIGTESTRAVATIALVVGLAALAAFTVRQLRLASTGRALLDVRVLRLRVFAVSMAAMAVSFLSLMGAIIVLQLYLQQVLRQPALVAGLVVMPGGIAMGLLGPLVGRLLDRFGGRVLMIPGALLVLGAIAGFATLTEITPLALVVGLHVVLSVGLSLLFTPLFTLGLGVVPPHLYSHGSSVLGTTQQVAGAMGTALFVTVCTALGGDVTGVRWAFGVGAALALVVLALVVTLPSRAGGEAGPVTAAH